MIRLILNGANGRMGQRIAALASADDRFKIVAERDLQDARTGGGRPVPNCDVIIDFSSPEGTRQAVSIARETGAALLVGTTGHPPEIVRELDDSARSIALLISPNTSLGVAVLTALATLAARLLGPSFDIDLLEAHHAAKRDAPSGTAVRIVSALREQAGRDLSPEHVFSIRAGDVVGEHEIFFCGTGEKLRLAHIATSRDVFAQGALRAAAWLAGRPPGRYRIEDVLGITPAGT